MSSCLQNSGIDTRSLRRFLQLDNRMEYTHTSRDIQPRSSTILTTVPLQLESTVNQTWSQGHNPQGQGLGLQGQGLGLLVYH